MKITTIINIIAASFTTISIIVIIILGTILYSKNVELRMIKQENNILSQTVKQLRSEEEQRIEIMNGMQERLKKAEEVKDYQEAKRIWLDVWQSLESR